MALESAEVLREALRDLHKGETLERAVGRIVRRLGGKFEDYTRIIFSVREMAQRAKITPLEAAKRLANPTGPSEASGPGD